VATGALSAWVREFQVLLVPASAGFLALGYYLAYRRGAGTRRQRALLWVGTPLTVLSWVLPRLLG
jgi:hypothetical protein